MVQAMAIVSIILYGLKLNSKYQFVARIGKGSCFRIVQVEPLGLLRVGEERVHKDHE